MLNPKPNQRKSFKETLELIDKIPGRYASRDDVLSEISTEKI